MVSRSGQNFYNLVKWFWQTFNGSTDGNQKYATFSSFSFLGKFSPAVVRFVKHCSFVCWEVNPKEWLMLWQEMLCNIKLFIKNLSQKNWKEGGFEHLGLRGRNRCWSMPTVKLYVQVSNVKRQERLSGSKQNPSVGGFCSGSGLSWWFRRRLLITADQSSIAPAPVLTRQQDGKEVKEEKDCWGGWEHLESRLESTRRVLQFPLRAYQELRHCQSRET